MPPPNKFRFIYVFSVCFVSVSNREMLLGAWPLGGKNVSALTNNHGKARLLCLCGSYILYLVIGASIIAAIEIPPMEQDATRLNNLRTQFLQKNKCIKGTYHQNIKFIFSVAV